MIKIQRCCYFNSITVRVNLECWYVQLSMLKELVTRESMFKNGLVSYNLQAPFANRHAQTGHL